LSGEKNQELWTGGISLAARLKPNYTPAANRLTMDEVRSRVSALGQFFVPTRRGAGVRCIDGSTLLGYDDMDPRWFARSLGPQVQGGTLGEAVAWRMWHGVENGEEVSFLKDLQKVAELPTRYGVGAHTDDHANADAKSAAEKSGCGQYDGQARKLPLYGQAAPSDLMVSTAATLLDLANIQANPKSFERLQTSARDLLRRTAYFASAHEAIAEIHKLNPEGLEKVVRPHNEVSLTVNFVPGTTFHRDHYNAGTDSKIQNFGLDAWYIVEKYGEAGYALVVDAVATAMDLTDGSLLLFARLPNV
jgi:hypothetical protein